MKLTHCKKASIYDMNHLYLCDASVSNPDDSEDMVILQFAESSSELLRSEVYVTFYDSVSGLITCFCMLSDYKESLIAPNLITSTVNCYMKEQISVIQRRNDLKVPITLETILTFKNEEDILVSAVAVIRDISAGGLFLTSHYPFLVGQSFSFSFNEAMPSFQLTAEVLRVQSPHDYDEHLPEDDKLFGYGCRFIDLSPYKESVIRNFVYKQDIHRQKGRRQLL